MQGCPVRAWFHVGLAALLVIAPALCCCNVRLLAGLCATATASPPSRPAESTTAPPSCCHAVRPVPQSSCCNSQARLQSDAPKSQNSPEPAAPKHRCDFCGEKPSATPPKNLSAVSAPEPTGELIPVALLGLTALPPEHLVLLAGLEPSGWAGVNTRSESLFARHVLRC